MPVLYVILISKWYDSIMVTLTSVMLPQLIKRMLQYQNDWWKSNVANIFEYKLGGLYESQTNNISLHRLLTKSHCIFYIVKSTVWKTVKTNNK